jgi:hypothetical protein
LIKVFSPEGITDDDGINSNENGNCDSDPEGVLYLNASSKLTAKPS